MKLHQYTHKANQPLRLSQCLVLSPQSSRDKQTYTMRLKIPNPRSRAYTNHWPRARRPLLLKSSTRLQRQKWCRYRRLALNSHEQLGFPLAPLAAIKRKQTQLTEQRKDGLVDVRRRLEGQDRSTAAKDRTPSQDWEDAVDAAGAIACPFCFHALPAWEVVDETKWKYVHIYSTCHELC